MLPQRILGYAVLFEVSYFRAFTMANEQVEAMGDEQQAFVLVLWADDEHQCRVQQY